MCRDFKHAMMPTRSHTDRRSVSVRLTPAGEREFVRVFAPHIAHCKRGFAGWSAAELAGLEAQLVRLRDGLHEAASLSSTKEASP